MASAYAALVSLMNVLHIIIHPKNPASNSHLDNSQVQSLFDKVNSLVDLLETHSHRISKDSEKRMKDAAFAAEDMIESYLVGMKKFKSTSAQERSWPVLLQHLDKSIQEAEENINNRSSWWDAKRRLIGWWVILTKCSLPAIETCPPLSQHLNKVIQEMDLIIQEAMQVEQNSGEHDQLLTVPVGLPVHHGDTFKLVGLEEETNHLIHQLTSYQSDLQIIPIVGMGGLGKTTLAVKVYNHPHLWHHFDIKAWVTISQVYTPRTVFSPLLHAIGVDAGHIDDDQLGEKLHKGLFGRRYLIIIDDIWDLRAWDEVIRFCPNNNNGSRILLTTRLLDVANRVCSGSPFELQLLDAYKSWDLLSNIVFEQEVCPQELEQCGKEIARNCKGLPLAIVVIGGLLKVSGRTRKHWEHVGKNIRSIIGAQDNDHCMKILSLSYHELPIHLKPCFLYMATFPEDAVIWVSDVTKLWVADGFLKPREDGKSLDEVALECLTDLINRNLVIVMKRNNRGEVKCLSTHDLVRDLCIQEAQKDKFLCVDDGFVDLPNTMESQRRLVVHGNGCNVMQQKGFLRSLIWFRKQHFPPEISWLNLLRVLDSSQQKCLVEEMMRHVNLRFLKFSISIDDQLSSPSSISWPLNLETLILEVRIGNSRNNYILPVKIWNLWRLKHLIITRSGAILPNPPTSSDSVLENLQTLKGVEVLSYTVLGRIPNIKSICVRHGFTPDKDGSYNDCEHYNGSDHYKSVWALCPSCRFNFACCDKLEKLRFRCSFGRDRSYKFPHYLRKLTLYGTKIRCENLTIVGSLPNLDFLYLGWAALTGEEWKSVEGEFEKLTFLEISQCDLVRWAVEGCSHFPSLERLILKKMGKLEEIPEVFGELMTLVSIKLLWCSKSVVVSARQILEEQQQGGNDDLIVIAEHRIPFLMEYTEQLKEELEGLPNDNFHLTVEKVGKEKDPSSSTQKRTYMILAKKVETLNKAMEVESKKLQREIAALEKRMYLCAQWYRARSKEQASQ